MRSETKNAAGQRLSRIEGQVRGISRMISEERYCIDVVRQIQAVKAALSSVEHLILDDHLDSCVEKALSGDDLSARKDKVNELVSVLGGRRK